MVVAQLAKRLLPTPEVRGSNPVIGEFYSTLLTVNCIEKTKIKKKRPGMAHFKEHKISLFVANTFCSRIPNEGNPIIPNFSWNPNLNLFSELQLWRRNSPCQPATNGLHQVTKRKSLSNAGVDFCLFKSSWFKVRANWDFSRIYS